MIEPASYAGELSGRYLNSSTFSGGITLGRDFYRERGNGKVRISDPEKKHVETMLEYHYPRRC